MLCCQSNLKSTWMDAVQRLTRSCAVQCPCTRIGKPNRIAINFFKSLSLHVLLRPPNCTPHPSSLPSLQGRHAVRHCNIARLCSPSSAHSWVELGPILGRSCIRRVQQQPPVLLHEGNRARTRATPHTHTRTHTRTHTPMVLISLLLLTLFCGGNSEGGR